MLKDKQGRENVKTKEPRGKEQKVSRKENREEKEKLGWVAMVNETKHSF